MLLLQPLTCPCVEKIWKPVRVFGTTTDSAWFVLVLVMHVLAACFVMTYIAHIPSAWETHANTQFKSHEAEKGERASKDFIARSALLPCASTAAEPSVSATASKSCWAVMPGTG